MRLSDLSFVVVDLEASSGYPLSGEICEIGAVKWKPGLEPEVWQSLIKPSEPMSDFIIGIHGITNEMVALSPSIDEKIAEFRSFIEGSILVAHHAPFDVGFLTVEFERAGLDLPSTDILCTSLLSIALHPEAGNHRLSTLAQHFQLERQPSHRALDDCYACQAVLERCFDRLKEPTLEAALEVQGKPLLWQNFSLRELRSDPLFQPLFVAIADKKHLEIVYGGGKGVGKTREIRPIGIVRNPDEDFLFAHCLRDKKDKRFYLKKIKQLQEK